MDDNKVTTTVSETEINLDEILNPGADSVMLPGDDQKPNLFTRKPEDLSFLDKPEKKVPPTELSEEEKKKKIASGELNEDGTPKVVQPAPDEIDNILNNDDESKKTGRPKLDKQGLVELATKLIEKKLIAPFEEDKPIDQYTLQDFEELFEANFQDREERLRKEIPNQFYQSLPHEMKYAAKYLAEGGQDMKGLFRMLAAVEEVRQMDPADDNDSESIVRSYLQATNFGEPDEIEEEINSWKDRNELTAKAAKFKPKLDKMQEELLQYKIQEQQQLKEQQEEQRRIYTENVYNVLAPGELNGIKLDKKIQGLLYGGLTQPQYPSVTGKSTNLLGHLLEKYQFVEPRHDLIAEVLWLLADPDGYKSKVREVAEKKAVEKTVRTLKTEEKNKVASTDNSQEDGSEKRSVYKIQRPSNSFFKR